MSDKSRPMTRAESGDGQLLTVIPATAGIQDHAPFVLVVPPSKQCHPDLDPGFQRRDGITGVEPAVVSSGTSLF